MEKAINYLTLLAVCLFIGNQLATSYKVVKQETDIKFYYNEGVEMGNKSALIKVANDNYDKGISMDIPLKLLKDSTFICKYKIK